MVAGRRAARPPVAAATTATVQLPAAVPDPTAAVAAVHGSQESEARVPGPRGPGNAAGAVRRAQRTPRPVGLAAR